jgi:hypothetical protein
MFRKLALLPSSGEWRGRREEHVLSVCFSLLPIHSPEDGSRASFRNVVILIFNILLFG